MKIFTRISAGIRDTVCPPGCRSPSLPEVGWNPTSSSEAGEEGKFFVGGVRGVGGVLVGFSHKSLGTAAGGN